MRYSLEDKVIGEYIERDLEEKIRQYKDKPEIIAVTGPRQSGKTTLLLKIHEDLENSNFISFEDREALDLFEEDVKSFGEQHLEGYDYLIIDEFQYAEEGGKGLKYIYDHYPDKNIFVTGSSAVEMTVKGLQHLTGRVLNFKLFPLSFEEFLKYKDEKLYRSFERTSEELIESLESGTEQSLSETLSEKLKDYRREYLVYGGYPRAVVSDSEEEKEEVLKNIINTYLLKEIREVLDIAEDRKIRNLIKLLSLQIGDLVSYNKLGDRSGYSYKQLKEKLGILEQTFVVKFIDPFFRNKQKEIVKSPKTYFYDNGFRNAVINNFQDVRDRNDRGELNENFFFSQAVQRGLEVKFWRSRAGAEVDFLYESPGLTAFEIKTTPKKTRAMRSFIDKYSPERFFVLNEDKLDSGEDLSYLPLIFSGKLIDTIS